MDGVRVEPKESAGLEERISLISMVIGYLSWASFAFRVEFVGFNWV